MIRQATLADLPAILDIAREQAVTHYPRLRWDPSRAGSQLRAAISSARHFAWCVEAHSYVAGALIALVNDNAWAQRCSCNVVLWCSKVPGQGSALLREFVRWVDSRPIVKVSGFAPDIELDPRVWLLVQRIGFQRHGGAYLRWRLSAESKSS